MEPEHSGTHRLHATTTDGRMNRRTFPATAAAAVAAATQTAAQEKTECRTCGIVIMPADVPGMGSIVVCGAALAGTAFRLQSRVPLPLIDGIACAVRQAEMLVGLGLKPRRNLPVAKLEMQGITPELADLYRNA